jgi:CxC6 like cysteine cluster associated with KDZ transposases
MDGVTVGRPTCGVPRCVVPLASNRHRFCPDHTSQNQICAIVDCKEPTLQGKRTCKDPVHQRIEQVHMQRQEAQFQMKEQLKRARMAHPKSGEAQDIPIGEVMEKEIGEIEETYEIIGDRVVPGEAETVTHTAKALASLETVTAVDLTPALNLGKKSKKLRAQFGRTRTHNEQILVAPCGMIIARETFYFSEAIPSVVVSSLL